MPPVITFPDINGSYQDIYDWPALRAFTPIIAIKTSQNGHKSDRFDEYRKAAIDHAFEAILLYDYLGQNIDAATSARDFMNIAGAWDPTRDVACCDLEEGAGDQSHRLDAWNNAIPAGDTEMDYSGLSFWLNKLANTTSYAASWHRWIAAYQRREPSALHLAWQRADNLQFPGIRTSCDGSTFNGTIEQFKAMVGLTPGTPAPPIATGKSKIHIPPFAGEMKLGDVSQQVAATKVYLIEAGYQPIVKDLVSAQTYDVSMQFVATKLQKDHDAVLFLGKDTNTADYWINQPHGHYHGEAFGPQMWNFLAWELMNR